jgi:hypothetical protein
MDFQIIPRNHIARISLACTVHIVNDGYIQLKRSNVCKRNGTLRKASIP